MRRVTGEIGCAALAIEGKRWVWLSKPGGEPLAP
jgi:hypothetical protein